MALKPSPLAVPLPAALPPIAGIRLATAEANIRYRNRTDVLLAAFDPGTTVAGVFTRNQCPGAPISWCREILPGGTARALVVNSGNANVFTGAAGIQAVETTANAAAATLGIAANTVFLASTGVIGEPLPTQKIVDALPDLRDTLSDQAFAAAARAIMTTDTFPKAATATATLGGTQVRITGIAKGSGMIAPDMATMLCFVFTDAALPAATLQSLLRQGSDASFNCITVDSDTSTSDAVLIFATGTAGNQPDADTSGFALALNQVLHDLALMVVRDGEGATKLFTVKVGGAVSDASAKRIALAIANSPLVKTAIAGEDANWGRIVMAVGKAGEPADRDKLAIAVGGTWMARNGGVIPGYDEAPVVAHMKGQEIEIEADIGLGRGQATVWSCDLTHGYIDINGSYRS